MIRVHRSSSCLSCKHFKGIKQDKEVEQTERPHCSAFDSIPPEIWTGLNDHRTPYPGDNGIVFQQRKRIANE